MEAMRAVVFDAYGTLFDVQDAVAAVCDRRFPGYGKALGELWRRKQLEYTWLCSLMGQYRDFWRLTEDALAYALKALGLNAAPDARRELLEAYRTPPPYPEVSRALEAMVGKTLAILSNGTAEMLRAAVANAGLAGRFAAVISADEARVYKPHPDVYARVLTRLGVAKEDVLFVTANAWDAAGAKQFGFRVCWLNRFGMPFDEGLAVPDRVVERLDQLF
ncbi:haloacid dehalogenase type II [Calditerricola satsumensis]|uniref:Haloacid dehalogenase n=1 Tax=Calditerricola satsumensis TaxID=373054 RepID=A0A8J3B2L8_9BACI|nr:haloacid dehalogenase type II [Calditerricola satsumensis]GGJ91349.1 haloacid dehalogenase [Calditerricola satsumensis]